MQYTLKRVGQERSIRSAMGNKDENMSNSKEIKGIIFDLGGVVIEEFEYGFYDDVAKRFGVSAKDIDRVADFEWAPLEKGEETNEHLWKRVARKLGLDDKAGETMASMWLECYKKEADIKDDVLELVKKLHKKYKLGVISNSQQEHSKINRERLSKYFDAFLLSDELGMRKPQREIFELTSKKMEIPFENLLFIDNDMRWVNVAKKYGLQAILFESVKQLEKELEKLGIRMG